MPELSTRNLAELSINTIRTLAMDAVQEAKSGHPGTPMALAPLAYALWTRVLRYDGARADWPDRDRFVLSCGHASMLLYAMLHLTGDDLDLDDIKAFRQWGSKTAGHPEFGHVRGVETTTGPLGQGFGNAVGMALAERALAARFNRPGHDIVDHRTWVIASDGDLMEGVCQEAASLAGHLGLGRLCVFYDDNRITIDGRTDASFTEDVAKRFEAYGWHVVHVGLEDGVEGYVTAAEAARAEAARPTLVICRTIIGIGAPKKADTPAAHGAPLGVDEIAGAKRSYGWPEDARFLVPDEVRAHMREAGRRGAVNAKAWDDRFAAYKTTHPGLAAEFERAMRGEIDPAWAEALPSFEAGSAMATRQASGKVLDAIQDAVPELIGGSADLAGSNNTWMARAGTASRDDYSGRNVHYGIREHGMGSIMNGLALHGGVRPFGGTFLVFADYMRPAIRMAALMGLNVVYVFTHDSIGVGEDGPTHQPIEQVASLRAIPGLRVIRPADGAETAEAWRQALERKGPTALVLTRQKVPELVHEGAASASGLAGGAYALREGGLDPDLCLMATGSEVALALEAADRLASDDLDVRVVSFPCWELLETQDDATQSALLGGDTVRVAVEAGTSFGWTRWVGRSGGFVTIDHFGASAPGDRLMEEYGFTPENVARVAREALGRAAERQRRGQP